MRSPIWRALCLGAMIALSFGVCTAQTTAAKPSEPESIGTFFYLDPATQTLKRLPTEEFKRHNGGFGSITQSIKVAGPASSLHIDAKDQTIFVFKVFKEEAAARVKLFQFTVKGDEREYELGKWKRRDFTPNVGVTVNVAKFGESSFKVTPEAPLAPGEYALTMGPQVFTFSIGGSGVTASAR